MSSKLYRIGVIGFAHMHVNTLLDQFHQLPNTEWVACADLRPRTPSLSQEPGTRRANVRYALDVIKIPKHYEDYGDMLEKEEFDIMIVCTENALHCEVVRAVAAKGIHIVVEKPMATTLADALKMVRAVEFHGVTLAVNWPSTWWGHFRKAHQLVQAGEIGHILTLKYRNHASLGPLAWGQKITEQEKGAEWWHQSEPGGGAYLDYCCYGACVSRWFMGESAVAAYALKANLHSHYGDADDNAVVVARYPKSIAMFEGSWTMVHGGVTNGPIIYGTTGTLVCKDNKVLIYREKGASEPAQVYEDNPLPKGRENIAKELVHCLETGEPLHETLDIPINLDAMALLDAGIRSSVNGKQELVNNAWWSIG